MVHIKIEPNFSRGPNRNQQYLVRQDFVPAQTMKEKDVLEMMAKALVEVIKELH